MNISNTQTMNEFRILHGPLYMRTGICESWKRHKGSCRGCKHYAQCEKFVKAYVTEPEQYGGKQDGV